MKTFSFAIATLILGAVSAVPLSAQLSVTVEDVNDPSTVGDTVTLEADAIGDRVGKRLRLQFDPGTDASISLKAIQILGSNEFSYEIEATSLPISISGDFVYEVLVFYTPRTAGPASGVLQVTTEIDGSELASRDTVFTINLVGKVPAYSLSYTLPGGSARNLPVGSGVDFGHRPTGAAAEATLVVLNSGSRYGTVNSVSVTGESAFRLVSPPRFPLRLEPAQSVSIQVAFNPASTRTYRGELRFSWDGTSRSVSLTGIGGDLLSYSLTRFLNGAAAGPPASVKSGTQIVFGAGATSVHVIGRNARQSAQLIESARATGPFSATTTPALPASLAPQEELVVALEPAPSARVGDIGSLVIGDAIFPLLLDLPELPAVQFSMSGGTVRGNQELPLGLSLARPYPVDITGVLDLAFESAEFHSESGVVWATGGRQASFTIPAGQTAAVFSAGANAIEFQTGRTAGEIAITARFVAAALGIAVAPAQAPEVRFSVEIPALPAVTFSQAGGTVGGNEAVPLGLSIASAYPDDIRGTLDLVFESAEFQGDSGVVWSTGTRQASFTIPAGQTAAVFGGGATEIEFQTGKTAGEVTITARFVAEPTGIDVTPDDAPEVRFSVEIPALPAVTFSQAGGTVGGNEAVPLGLSIASAYPDDVRGTLDLVFESAEFQGDSGVVWSTGTRQASFTIPAGQTAAVFGGGATEIEFQTGRTAGEITITARFVAEPTGIDVTPDDAPEVRFSVEIPALPAVTFSQAGGTVGGNEAVPLGLSIASAYPDDIRGTLDLVFESAEFQGDSGVVWSTGTRQASFTIPAGQTAAVFGGGATEIEFQTGKTAGEVTITARFVAEPTGIDVTPDDAPEVRFSVEIPALPAVTFSQAGGTVGGNEAVPLGLSIASAYPDDIRGTLDLVFESAEFQGDSGVVWSTGTRQASFTIPAGQTAAVFGGGATEIEFQTGRTAGEITITARFVAEPTGIDVTPDDAPEVRFSVEIPALPEVTFSQAGGTVGGNEAVPMGLSIASAYPDDIRGTLDLVFESAEFQGDSGVVWSTGTRQASFTIPAGQTAAVFGGGATEIEFQTGKTAGDIVVTARFFAELTGKDITPDDAPEVRFSVEIPALPEVTFSQAGGTIGGNEAVPLGLSIASAYPDDIRGTLDLVFESAEFQGDSGVVWSTGTRQASFTIPAGQTAAVFGGGATEIEFQTGRTAGEITITARFVAEPTGIDVTPDDAPEVRFSVEIPALPEVTFSQAGGTVRGNQAVPLGLSIASAYPDDIRGTLDLVFESAEFQGDSGVVWSTGTRQASFTIPAGQTAAVFGGGATEIEFQTGRTAGDIVVTARFFAEPTSVEITPDDAPEVRFNVEIVELPEVIFSQMGGTVGANQEVSLGLSLASAYPDDLEGTLELAFAGTDFRGDSGAVWSTGSRQASFTIAAGETAAVFTGGAGEIEFQSGRAAGEIVITARFKALPLSIDVTPDEVPEVQFSVEIPALPEVIFSQSGGTVNSADQVTLSVSLSDPYPGDVVGFLELRFETRVIADDPAIRWVTGGRQAAFQIPAGETQAVFLGSTAENTFQTGTVAGEIQMTAQFYSVRDIEAISSIAQAVNTATDITPDTVPGLRFSVMEAAPVLQRVVLGSTSSGRFTMQVTGHATTRSVDSMAFTLAGRPGSLLTTPDLQAEVSQSFATYYAGNQSNAFGSQFTATVEFFMDEGVFEDLASMSVTATNGMGTSNSVSVQLGN